MEEANPPTLMLPIMQLAKDFEKDSRPMIKEFIAAHYDLIKTHLFWFYNFHVILEDDLHDP